MEIIATMRKVDTCVMLRACEMMELEICESYYWMVQYPCYLLWQKTVLRNIKVPWHFPAAHQFIRGNNIETLNMLTRYWHFCWYWFSDGQLISGWLGIQQNVMNLPLDDISWHVCKTLFTRGFVLSWLSMACNTDMLSENITKLVLEETFT